MQGCHYSFSVACALWMWTLTFECSHVNALRTRSSLANVMEGCVIHCYVITVPLVENMIRRRLTSLDIINQVEFESFHSDVQLGILANNQMKVRGGVLTGKDESSLLSHWDVARSPVNACDEQTVSAVLTTRDSVVGQRPTQDETMLTIQSHSRPIKDLHWGLWQPVCCYHNRATHTHTDAHSLTLTHRCTHWRTHTGAHTRAHTLGCTHWRAFTDVHTDAHTRAHTHGRTHQRTHWCTHTDAHSLTYTHRRTHGRTHMNTHPSTHTHWRRYTDLHTITHTRMRWNWRVHIDAHTLLHTHQCIHTDAHTLLSRHWHTHTDAHTLLHTHWRTHTDGHVGIHIHSHRPIETHTHTHTHLLKHTLTGM